MVRFFKHYTPHAGFAAVVLTAMIASARLLVLAFVFPLIVLFALLVKLRSEHIDVEAGGFLCPGAR